MSLQELTQVAPEPLDFILPDEESSESLASPRPKLPGYLKRILLALGKAQKYSAYGFLAFFGLHLSSSIVAPAIGVPAEKCQEFFEMTRAVYLLPLFEYPIVFGCAGIHVASGFAVRVLRLLMSKQKVRRARESQIIIQDDYRDDIGLGGLGTILGLGFKKSWISANFPSFTPLTFSGYVMALALGFHVYKMRLAPAAIDGDSSLINLNFVTHYLHQSFYGKVGALFNYSMLALLLWVSLYHMVSGLFKYRRQFSLRAKKIAYGVIGFFTGLSLISITRLRLWPLDLGFIGTQFAKYLYAA